MQDQNIDPTAIYLIKQWAIVMKLIVTTREGKAVAKDNHDLALYSQLKVVGAAFAPCVKLIFYNKLLYKSI